MWPHIIIIEVTILGSPLKQVIIRAHFDLAAAMNMFNFNLININLFNEYLNF